MQSTQPTTNLLNPSDNGIFFQKKRVHGVMVEPFTTSFGDIFSDWTPNRELFLFFTPHDDDAAISTGLLIREARRQEIPVRIIIVTDGRNGYLSLDDRSSIIERRAAEAIASYGILGVPEEDISFLKFPDGGLQNYYGRRSATATDPSDEHGFTGLENHFVRELRRRVVIDGVSVAPTRIFVPSLADYHQDHVAVAREVPISIFHALGGIWPECGQKIDTPPFLYWHCVYCKLPSGLEPSIKIHGSPSALAEKVQAVEAYNSQGQIAGMIEGLREAPPVEYLLEERFSLYTPGTYDYCFS